MSDTHQPWKEDWAWNREDPSQEFHVRNADGREVLEPGTETMDADLDLASAAPAMARALLAVYEHDKRFRESPEDANRSPIEAVAAALVLAGVPLP